MPLQIEIVSDHKDSLGDNHVRQFGHAGGTIGRSVRSDWIIPDPDNYVSGRHCTIDYQAGAYYLADTSTNGVYINGEKKPVGKGNPRRLFNGDRLRMGDFEFLVSLDEGEDLAMPASNGQAMFTDHAGQRVHEDQAKSCIELLDEEAITGDDAFKSTLLGSSAKAEKFRVEPGLSQTQAVPLPRFAGNEAPQLDAKPLLEAFIKGLGIARSDIHPTVDMVDLMENAGNILREFVTGASELLAGRSAVKNLFKMEETVVLPQYNNPLKVAEDSKDSLLQLLIGKESDHLAPADAVKQVCRDLKYHHDAMLGAMTAAFLEFVDRFDPDELQANFDGTLNSRSFFQVLNRLRYWRMYSDLYPIITQPGAGQFPHQFGEAFVRAYIKLIGAYKYHDGPTGETQAVRSINMSRQAPAQVRKPAKSPTPNLAHMNQRRSV